MRSTTALPAGSMHRVGRSSRRLWVVSLVSSTASSSRSYGRSGASSTVGGRTTRSTGVTSKSCSSRAATCACTATGSGGAGSRSAPDVRYRTSVRHLWLRARWRDRVILHDRLRGERLPLRCLLGWEDHPLAEGLTAARRIEQVGAGNGERPRVRAGVG